MRALYIIDRLETNYPRDQIYIMKYMASMGHEVTAVTTDSSNKAYDSKLLDGVRVERSVPVAKVTSPRAIVPIYMPSRRTSMQMLSGRFDIVHSFTFLTFSSILGAVGVRAKKVLRTEVGQPIPKIDGYATNYGRIATSGILRTLTRFYSQAFDYLTVYTSAEAESLKLLGVPQEKVTLLPLMVDYDAFSRLRSDSGKKPMTFGCIARIHHIKGVDRTIAPFRRLQERGMDFRFILAGRPEQEPYSQSVLEDLRSSLGNNFKYLGELAPPYNFYRIVDVVIVPSRYETGAIVVLEAMAAGKLVIASDIYPINTYIINGKNGYLFRDENGLMAILEQVGRDGVDRRMIDSAVQSARDYHFVTVLERYYKPLFC